MKAPAAGARSVSRVRRALHYVWAGPWSLAGLALGAACLLLGGRCQLVGGVVEFAGGRLGRGASRTFVAITFGHVVLGANAEALDGCREHERIHVRQYERWGPLFVPAYLASSLWQWLRGRDPYRDNRFECEAYAAAPCAATPKR